VPPQVASVDTFLLGVEDGAEEERVDDGGVNEVVGLLFVQVPNAGLQPVPQCAGDEPHQPYCEQQVPDGLPIHVYPAVPPHVPSGDTVAAWAKVAESKPTAKMKALISVEVAQKR